MTVNIISRAKWGAHSWNGSPNYVPYSRRSEFFVHYDGGTPVHRDGYAVPRAIERVHLNQGWAGIGYNFVVDQDGRIYEGRGWTRQGAHCPGHNVSGIGVQIAIGGSQEPTGKALAACRALYEEACDRTDQRLAMKGHRDGFATACPGGILYEWVQAGMPAGDYESGEVPQGGSGDEDHPPRYQKTINGKTYGYGAKGSHITAVDKALISKGFNDHHDGDGYQPGPNWTDYTTMNYADYQRSLGYSGEDADGVPGESSLSNLLKRSPVVDLSKVRSAARSNPPASGQPVTYSGVKHVEAALVAEGYLDEDLSDGHFGTATVSAYSRWQRELGYRGRDADGVPGETSLTRLGDKHSFKVKA